MTSRTKPSSLRILGPMVRVKEKRHAGGKWKEEVADAPPDDLLHQNTHLFVEIQQVVIPSIEDRRRPKRAHMDPFQAPE